MRFRASQVAAATGGRISGPDVEITGASFDSRATRNGQLFVPIVADRDGHAFIGHAISQGAVAYLTTGPLLDGATAIVVDETIEALLALGAWGRSQLPDRVVGITGSVGKTSVKDLTASVLATRWRTAASEKSFNNEFGLPTTILNSPAETEVLVLEMGMRGFGEIARLCAVGRPTVGLVTRIAAAHTGRVGGIEGVAKAKAELVEALPARGSAVLNADDPYALAMRSLSAAQVITFGRTAGDVRAEQVELDDRARARFRLVTPWGHAEIALGVSGEHMAINAAAAAAAGLVLDVPLDSIPDALAAAHVSPWRMELLDARGGGLVVNDAYNANPASMRAALDALLALPATRRVAVLGLMAELDQPEAAHAALAVEVRAAGVELIAVGTELYGVTPVTDPVAAVGSVGRGVAVLVKASRVAGLEQLAGLLAGG